MRSARDPLPASTTLTDAVTSSRCANASLAGVVRKRSSKDWVPAGDSRTRLRRQRHSAGHCEAGLDPSPHPHQGEQQSGYDLRRRERQQAAFQRPGRDEQARQREPIAPRVLIEYARPSRWPTCPTSSTSIRPTRERRTHERRGHEHDCHCAQPMPANWTVPVKGNGP
jgi:hypothetical protein